MRPVGLLFIVALTAAPLFADDWPQWRGPERDGTSREAGSALGWGEEGPPLLWRRQAGAGFSSVSVAGGRLFTAWQEGEDEVAVALDAASGAQIWRTRIDAPYENERGGGPRSAPTLDGDRLYLMSGRGRLVALATADGRLLWQHDLVGEYGAETPIWGFAASPLVEAGMVVVPVGGDKQAVAAFARGDGRRVWAAHSDAIGYSSPVAAELAGTRQIVALTGQSVSGLSLDGKLLWSHPWEVINNINIATPLRISENRVFVSTSYDVGAALLEITRGESGLVVKEVWRERVMKNHFQDSVLYRGYLYGFDNAFLKSIEAATGKELWRRRGFGKGHLVLAGDRLVVLGERGKMALVEASPEAYRELAAAELTPQRYWTPPSLADGRLFVRTESEIFALDLRGADAGAGGRRAAELAASPTAGAPVDAAELVQRNLEARGAETAWGEVRTLKLAGHFNLNGRESRITVWRRGAAVRYEIVFGELREVFLFDGERAWFKPLRDEGAAVDGERLRRLRGFADLYLPPRDPWQGFGTIEYLGEDDSGDEPLHRLRVSSGDSSQEWRLSANSLQVVETIRGTEERQVNTYQLDYRAVAGLLFPHYVEISFGTGMYSLTADEIAINPDLPDELFRIPG